MTPSKWPMPERNSLDSLYIYFFFNTSLALCVLLSWCWTWNNLACFHYYYVHLFYLFCFAGLCFPAARAVRYFYWLWIELLALMWVTCDFIIFCMFSSSNPGIPSSAGPSLVTTKNLHLAVLSLCLNHTVHAPNCLLSNWLYVFNMTALFFVVHTAADVEFGKRILNTLNGIK